MDRDSIRPRSRMIFVFKDEQPRAFWMRNTRIPAGHRVRQIRRRDRLGALDEAIRVSVARAAPARRSNAIELNEGVATAQNSSRADKLEIPRDARDAEE
jgi:uncharacterized membrane protein (UPF0127 family)